MRAFAVALLATLAISCADVDRVSLPPQAAVSTGELTFLRFSDDAYAAAEKGGSFWAAPGQDRSIALRYTDTGQEFMRFEVGATSLAGSDSVLITVRVNDAGNLVFHFEPSGLQFNTSAPALLRINHARANPDVDADGDVDLTDSVLETQATIWKQELPGLPWLKLPSINLTGDIEQAKVYDFTSFGMAID